VATLPKSSKRRPPSMYDVARAAGVSQTTVSFVVNDAPNSTIPQETRDRVWAAIKELGWQPNALARGLRMQTSHTIGLISDEIAISSHAGKIIQGAQDAAWDHTKMLLVINTGNNGGIERTALKMMLERQVHQIRGGFFGRLRLSQGDLNRAPLGGDPRFISGKENLALVGEMLVEGRR